MKAPDLRAGFICHRLQVLMFRFFENLVDPFPAAEPDVPPRKLGAFILHYSRPILPWLLVTGLLTALLSALEVVFLNYMGTLVDWLGEAERETFFAEYGWELAGMGALIVIGFPLLIVLQSLFTHQTVFGNYPMIGRWLMHRHVLQQSMSFFQNEFAGRISQKVMQTSLAIRETVMKMVDVFVYVSVYFTGAVVLMGQADLWLLVPLMLWLAGYIGLLIHFVPRLQRVSMAQADARAHMTGRVVDSYTNVQTVKLFAHTQREQDYARGAMQEFMGTVHPQMRLVTQLTVSLQTLNSFLLAGIGGVAIYAWYISAISLGSIAVAIALIMRIRAMSDWFLWEVAGLFENVGTVQDGMSTIAQSQTVKDAPDARALEVSAGQIEFDHIRFNYGQGVKVIDNLSLTIHPGEKVGIVGRSGAGKSTLVNLLLRFHDLEGGRILIDGQDISKVTQESLRRKIGMVTQDTSLLHRSIRDNICYGKPDASEAEVEAAIRQAQADGFIGQLEDEQGRRGLEAHAGERGVKLSGGQRQRIAIARVLLKNAPILILDEATSALDSEVEAAIQEQLYSLMEGKTVIAIAHRLSTIAVLDRLIVMDDGQIAETGTHEELLERGGLYADLWKRQSGGFIGLDLNAQNTEAAE